MRLAFSSTSVLLLVLAGCKDEPPSNNYTTGVADTESGDEIGSESDTSGSSSESTETGEPEPYVGVRYVVTGTAGALMLGVNLDDPSDVPDAQTIISGEIPVGLFETTPFGTQIVTHDDRLDQLSLTENGNYDFQPLVSQDAQWLDRIYFGPEGTDAIATISPTAFGAANQLIWAEYDAEQGILGSYDITPPIEANGAVLVLGRNPADTATAVLVDVELDAFWDLYSLALATLINRAGTMFLPFLVLYMTEKRGIPAARAPAMSVATVSPTKMASWGSTFRSASARKNGAGFGFGPKLVDRLRTARDWRGRFDALGDTLRPSERCTGLRPELIEAWRWLARVPANDQRR